MSTMRRTFVYKLKPTQAQEEAMVRYLDVTRALYNAALEQRIWAWRQGESRSLFEQQREIREARLAGLLEGCHVHTAQAALRRLDHAYDGFFRRVQSGARRKGFPRFKGERHWRSFTFIEYGHGIKLEGKRLRLSRIGPVRVRLHRPLEGQPKTVTVVRKADGWFAHIVCDIGDAPALRGGDRATGIDVGLESYATLASGEQIANPRHLRVASRRLAREQRSLARKRKGSKRVEDLSPDVPPHALAAPR